MALTMKVKTMREAIPEIDLSKCDGCGVCVERCPSAATGLVNAKLVIVRPEDCTYCADCEALCPTGAISCPFEIVLSNADQ